MRTCDRRVPGVTSRPLAVRDKGSVRKRSGRQMRRGPSERVVGHRKSASGKAVRTVGSRPEQL